MNSSTESLSYNKSLKGLFKTPTGDIRLFWVFIIIPVYLLVAIIVNRIIFIIIQTQIFLAEGYQQTIAVEFAQSEMMSLEAQAILGAFDTLLMVFLVYLLIKKIEKREFRWSSLGLDLRTSSIFYFILGSFLGFLFIIITRGISVITGTIQIQSLRLEEFFSQSNVKFMIYFYIWAIFNGFWQEIVFRGFLQTRVVEKYNPIVGIPAVTIYFILVHFIDRELTLSWVIAGSLLFILISVIFHITKSLFLVGAIHGSINYFDQVTELVGITWVTPIANHYLENSLLLVIILGIFLFVLYFRKRNKILDNKVVIH
ncbi:MAG: CPBP family intramembrane glutamic endopeptidase [Candidatus Hodarchaeales archaeon]|jgi:membrane protease YdiL (CAAX protease family)